ncbi:MAG: MoxR family ATPase [Pseudanabaenaceae cyanobacterium SKYGB_i_bin29]|nr:MoxR family ATPase [Pseudanabaenaceae cyanobacterium SKYG29]MDW8420540.1 MoxR family ATPase [Pseudanabaenaceae cyanobacterium SKYGB_i_bin29]
MDSGQKIRELVKALQQIIVGKDEAILLMLTALVAGGHALLEDVPGVGKTLLAKSLAALIAGKFQRVQCTPDLLPTDITGTNIWNPQTGAFQFMPGPVFAHVLLADEINRATPRTQSALLEVMEENQVTVDGVSRPVPSPFFTIATQNPVEYQGTFPLPEAQLDRFTLSFSLGYPSAEEELQMLQRQRGGTMHQEIPPCITTEEVLQLRQQCRGVAVSQAVAEYIVNLVRATREDNEISLGVSPRGTVALQRSAQAYALLRSALGSGATGGDVYVLPDDVKFLAPYVLGHRIIPAGRRSRRAIIDRLLGTVPVP